MRRIVISVLIGVQSFLSFGQRASYVSTSLTASQLGSLSEIKAGNDLLLYKPDRSDSCFLFRTQQKKLVPIHTGKCDTRKVQRNVTVANGQFVFSDHHIREKLCGLKKYFLKGDQLLLKDSLTIKADEYDYTVSASGNFELHYTLQFSRDSFHLSGLVYDNFTGYSSRIVKHEKADTALFNITEPIIDNSGIVHLFVSDKPENYRLGTVLMHYDKPLNTEWGSTSAVYRKIKVQSVSAVSLREKGILFYAKCKGEENFISEIRIVYNGQFVQNEQFRKIGSFASVTSTSMLFDQGKEMQVLHLIQPYLTRENDLAKGRKGRGFNLYTLHRYASDSTQLIFSLQPDNEVRDFISADYSSAQLQLLYSYKLLEEGRLFLSYVHAGPKAKINIHSLNMQRSVDVETDKNRIADLTGAMVLNDQIWMPAYDTKTGNGGFMFIDLNSVNK